MNRGWPFGSLASNGLDSLGPHVVAFYGAGYPYSNSAIVTGTESTLVFDANIFHYAQQLRRQVDEVAHPRNLQLVMSHAHADHVDGAMYFSPPAETMATTWTRRRLKWWTSQPPQVWVPRNNEYADQYPDAPAWYADYRMVVPEQAVDEDRSIDLGGVRVRLVPERVAHTPGDLWALVEPDGVALCGDLWFNDCEPYLASGSVDGSLAAIEHLRGAGARTYLPGHGLAGRIAPKSEDSMERYCLWIGEEVSNGLARGLAGPELARFVRARFEQQKGERNGIRFAVAWKGFIEDAVEAEELAARGEPLYAGIQLADDPPDTPALRDGSCGV